MSLYGMVHQGVAGRMAGRLADRLRARRAESVAEVAEAAAAPPTLADQVAALPSGSMRVLEGAIAVAAILTAVLIGIR